jgi:hypothetical protein
MSFVRLLVPLPIALALAAGCGSSKTSGFTSDAGSGNTDAGTFVSGDDSGSGGNFGTDGGSCPVTCGSDLRSFVDCNGNVVKTCPVGQGCTTGGQCVAACDAAKADKSSVGCDYWSVNPDTTYAAGACYAVFVANTWDQPVTLGVEYAGQALDPSTFAMLPSGSGQALTYAPLSGGQLPPGQIAVLFLAESGPAMEYKPACPTGVTPAVSLDAAPHDTSIGNAFHITATAPVVAYDIFPYGGGVSAITSATLLLPTTAWDTNYVAVDAYAADMNASAGSYPTLDVVAAQDGTTVTIAPTAPITGGTGVAATGQGQPATYSLSRGQVLHIAQPAELVGSPIQSNNPVGVVGGSRCFEIPASAEACDSAHQMIPPVKALGHDYVAARYRDRWMGQTESPPWRIVGAVDGTTLAYQPAVPPGAPLTLSKGQVADFYSPGGFSVTSQDDNHPFYMASYMTGGTQVGTLTDGRGDPEFVSLIPPQQWLGQYVFFTDPTYPETDLAVVRKARNGLFADVSLDCSGTVTGWQPAGDGSFQIAHVDLVTGNFYRVGSCDNGRHVMQSKEPFALTVWGWGSAATGGNVDPTQPQMGGIYSQWVSYGYPAGASVQAINTVVVPPVSQ